MSEIVYDATVKFCERFVSKYSRTTGQMIQAARSGRQNIAEGSMASAVSKETEIKLVGVARASLEELLLDPPDQLPARSAAAPAGKAVHQRGRVKGKNVQSKT
jgi:pantothenate kinase-related protein Tda10